MQEEQANSVEQWIALARVYRANAFLVVDMPGMEQLAWSSAGFACECLMKAAIMAKERLNSWPSRDSRRELHTHDLERLAAILGISIAPDDDVAAAWSVVTKWRRHHMYTASGFPAPVARSLLSAAFGEDGLEQWLFQSYLIDFK